MNKPKLDLSKPDCHVCGNPLRRNPEKKMEQCVHFACQVRNVDFSIPFLQEKSDDSHSRT